MAGVWGWQPHCHLSWLSRQVGSSTSHNPIGLHGSLLRSHQDIIPDGQYYGLWCRVVDFTTSSIRFWKNTLPLPSSWLKNKPTTKQRTINRQEALIPASFLTVHRLSNILVSPQYGGIMLLWNINELTPDYCTGFMALQHRSGLHSSRSLLWKYQISFCQDN
jgi:hypothetical protein